MNGATLDIANFIANTRWVDLSDEVRRQALRSFVNFVGCAVGGSQSSATKLAEQSLNFTGESGQSYVIGRKLKATPSLAALLNGISSSVNAFDDTHAEALVHPSSPVASALVGLMGTISERVSGEAFLLAFAQGIELACRLSKAISVNPASGNVGWSQSGITGAVGAAAGCGKLLGLDFNGIASAIGIAASLASGLRVAHGTMTMHLVPAQAGSIGVQAALLSKAGFTGPCNALEGRFGFLNLFSDNACVDTLISGLSVRYEMLRNTFKPYPCGIVINPVIEACLNLRSGANFDVADISEISMTVSQNTVALTDRQHPKTEFEAQVSVQHWAAVSLIAGAAGIKQGEISFIDNVTVSKLRDKCCVSGASDMADHSANVSIRFLNGGVIRSEIRQCRGSLANPMNDDEIAKKFLDQSEYIIGTEGAVRLHKVCLSIPVANDVRNIFNHPSYE
jgi:2-methylcitrate dehydratase PrpD